MWGGLGSKTNVRGLDVQFDHDDDTRAAVGDWIEVECAEILEVPNVRG